MRRLFWCVVVLVAIVAGILFLGADYLLGYALSPDADRTDTAKYYAKLREQYPDVLPWLDSMRAAGMLRDTFAVMPSGERHYAILTGRPGTERTAVLIHGWRNASVTMLQFAKVFHGLGYSCVLPDLHGHGLSEGDSVRMGWPDRLDVLHWIRLYATDTMVVHGVSMGAATAMMLSAEPMPGRVRDLRIVEDCGYTSVRDEFAYQLRVDFGLPEWPLLDVADAICRWRYGWSFSGSSAEAQLGRCRWPMLFIHGDSDTFVPTEMVHRLYSAHPGPKRLWVTRGVAHNRSLKLYPAAYADTLRAFLR